MTKKEIDELLETGDRLYKKNAPVSEWLKNNLIQSEEISKIKMTCGNEKLFLRVQKPNGQVFEWVGFGWIEIKIEDKTNIPVIY